jgi:hypothetical protein
MNRPDPDMEAAHRHCTGNQAALQQSRQAGCFYCIEVYPAEDLEFISIEQTAICPRCGIDSVLADRSGLPLTREFLKRMHEYWFSAAV